MKKYLSSDVLGTLFSDVLVALVLVFIPVALVGHFFYDFGFVEMLKMTLMIVGGFYTVFIALMVTVFVVIGKG